MSRNTRNAIYFIKILFISEVRYLKSNIYFIYIKGFYDNFFLFFRQLHLVMTPFPVNDIQLKSNILSKLKSD